LCSKSSGLLSQDSTSPFNFAIPSSPFFLKLETE
jgi:hypothetical protein